MLRAAGSLVSLFTLAGCAGLAATGARFDASGLATDPTLLVATTRKAANPTLSKPWFGPERASAMSVARLRLVPPSDSRLSLAAVGLDDWRIDRLERVAKVGDLFAPAAGARDVLIYVHGFNQTFETAALDAARLSDGIRFRGETMAFAWPSRAKLFDYGRAGFPSDDIVEGSGAIHVYGGYADDIICHCKSAEEARALWGAIADRFIRRKNGSEPPLHALFGHVERPYLTVCRDSMVKRPKCLSRRQGPFRVLAV